MTVLMTVLMTALASLHHSDKKFASMTVLVGCPQVIDVARWQSGVCLAVSCSLNAALTDRACWPVGARRINQLEQKFALVEAPQKANKALEQLKLFFGDGFGERLVKKDR